ncbi:MAG: alginate export family protein [Candidatus Aminicenantes bacterium]|nr:alginate export family protein [Acidobacteriota bacterium]MCG2810007.1 alginate export family protein [Candidatus Aminicenantes bacterium]
MIRRFILGFMAVSIMTNIILLNAQDKQGEKKNGKFKIFFWERIRQESWDNTLSLNENISDSSAYLRLRTSLGGQWRPDKTWEVNLRLTNENRHYLAPKSDPKLKKNFDFNEVFVDLLNVKWKNSGRLPLTVTLGRQELMLGEGFLIFDGGPLDGSRSAYFNGLRLDWAMKNKNNLTFFFVRQPRTDTLLPRINDKNQALLEQEEQGLGFYFSGRIKKTALDAYLFRKDTFKTGLLPAGALHVAGGRAVVPFTEKLSLTGEAALQLGTLGDNKRSGLGGYFHLDYKCGRRFPLPVQLTLGGIYLSGDDPETAHHEGWDAAFSRWPKWSDSLIYLMARETRVADWTNFISLYANLLFEPLEKVKLNLAWYRLTAPQKTPPSALLSGNGRSRGDLLSVKIMYDINKNLAGRFIWENFSPGDFYFAGADAYNWIQFELFFRF